MGMSISVRGCPIEMDMGWGTYTNFVNSIYEHIKTNHESKCLKGTIKFLEIETNDKTLGYLDCRDIYKDIQDMPDEGKVYGYAWNQKSLTDFKNMLKFSWKNRRVMWFT